MSTPLIKPDQLEYLIEQFTKELGHFTEEEQEQIISAFRWAQDLHALQKRASGEPYIIHPLHVARILYRYAA